LLYLARIFLAFTPGGGVKLRTNFP
jgi:hypothetical protein